MFVTCLYGVIDPRTGRFRFANAGPQPSVRAHRATARSSCAPPGCRSGLLPGMTYEEKEAVIAPGDALLLYSDGVTEAHIAPRARCTATPRLRGLVARPPADGADRRAAREPREFTGAGWEQEDDITLVTLRRGRQPRPPRRACSIRAAERGRATSARRWSASPRRSRRSGSSRAGSSAQDRGRRGDDERDRARQPEPRAELPVDDRGRTRRRRLVVRITDRGLGGPVGRSPRRPTSRPSSRGCRSRAAGDCS